MDSNECSDNGNCHAIIVQIDCFDSLYVQEELVEFRRLAASAGAIVADVIVVKLKKFESKTLIGSGKVAEIHSSVLEYDADIVLFNHSLTPIQERNLQRLLDCRVLDRTGLILDIFAQRAQTFEGKLQVELAQLQHLSTRLIRGWTHLERQKGGIGLRGPGEMQLETDRRLLRDRIKIIKKRLFKVQKQRKQNRRARRSADFPIISLVGYTNAGKSSLFNLLTNSDALVVDKLFATLDPMFRQVNLPGFGTAILVDTVGFIRNLPHDLVEAFSATLEEINQADLLLHVIDINDGMLHAHMQQVRQVLQQVGASHIPRIEVFNKIDETVEQLPILESGIGDRATRISCSAKTGNGINLLLQAIIDNLQQEIVSKLVELSPQQSKLRAQLYALQAVEWEEVSKDGKYILSIKLSKKQYTRLFIS